MSDAGQGGSGGVTFLNNLNGALSLAGSGGINIIPQEDGTITIHSSGGVVTPGGPPSAIQYNNAGALITLTWVIFILLEMATQFLMIFF